MKRDLGGLPERSSSRAGHEAVEDCGLISGMANMDRKSRDEFCFAEAPGGFDIRVSEKTEKALTGIQIHAMLIRFCEKDWGEVSEKHWHANDSAATSRGLIMAAYNTVDGNTWFLKAYNNIPGSSSPILAHASECVFAP